jgi:membrane protein DedA with SNARE-associated domain
MTLAGYLFGNIPQVKSHFEVVVLAIVFISVIPVAFHAVRSRRPPPVAEPVGVGDGSETRGV